MPFKIIWIVYKYILKVLHLYPRFILIAILIKLTLNLLK